MPDLDDDLFATFKNEGSPVNPLPASEVRRRGDRMRRRNNTLAAVGGVAAALIVVATPVAVVTQQGNDEPAPPIATQTTEAPQVSWLQEIPADLPLTAGLADGAETSEEPGVPLLTLCGQTAFDADLQMVDVAGVIARGTPNSDEPELSRTLALYSDASTAEQAVDRLRDAVEACPSEVGAGGDTIRHELITSELDADESFLYTDSYVAAGEDFPQGISYYVVVRTGNAVLVTSDPFTVPYDPQVTIEQDRVADLVDAMQVFSPRTD